MMRVVKWAQMPRGGEQHHVSAYRYPMMGAVGTRPRGRWGLWGDNLKRSFYGPDARLLEITKELSYSE